MPTLSLARLVGHTEVVTWIGVAYFATGALASVLRTWIEETSRTRRWHIALQDTGPEQRAKILTAINLSDGRRKRRED